MDIREIALEFCGRGGKRLRPRLCKAVFERCGGTGDIGGVCEASESFHKASLIHDDIQDGDVERYGRPTVWKEHGVAVAIAVGDWLVAHGYRLIAESGFAAMPQMLHVAALAHMRLCEGQGDDLLSPSTPQRLNISTPQHLNSPTRPPTSPSANGRRARRSRWRRSWGRWRQGRTMRRFAVMVSPSGCSSRSTTTLRTARIPRRSPN